MRIAGCAALALVLCAFSPAMARQQSPPASAPVDQADPDAPPLRNDLEERIEVLEEPWKVGDLKTYSLIFDYAPFGRQTVRLDRVLVEDGEKIMEFSQMLHLDLRALGQEGSLYNFGSVRYARGKLFRRYKFDEVLKSWSGYSTYEPQSKMRERNVTLERTGDQSAMSIKTGGGKPESQTLPPMDGLAGSVLIDLEIIGHWERLFLFDTWALGEEKKIPMMVPSEPVVYDYHLPVKDFRPIAPRVEVVTLRVQAMEDVSVFSINIPAFRCVIEELGCTLWVTKRGGVIKFDNGRGLTGILER